MKVDTVKVLISPAIHCLAILCTLAALPASAQVIPISPQDFQPGAQVETFEDMYTAGAFFSLLPGTVLPSGAIYAGPDTAMVVDFTICTVCGFTFPGGEAVDPSTTLPSGTAFGSLCGYPVMTVEFSSPVEAVGTYFEESTITLTAYDVNQSVLGFVTATGDGVVPDNSVDSWLGLAAADATAAIASVTLAGICFVIDDLTFGRVTPLPPQTFVRGDCNADGHNNIADAVFLLGVLFPQTTSPTIPCEDACDANDDGSRNIADAVAFLNSQFGLPPAPLPGPILCGIDPTRSDSYECDLFPGCP